MTDVVELLTQLVAIDTQNPTGNELSCAELVRGWLLQLRPDELELATVRRPGGASDSAFVFARWGTPRIVLNAHIDTVPTSPGWSRNPLQCSVEGERVYGLGTADTKGAIAAAICALRSASPRDVAVLFSGDEEHGQHCMRGFLSSDHVKTMARVIVCEPTSMKVGVRHRGIVTCRAKASGPGGHSSRADHIRAPLALLAQFATALDAWGKDHVGRGPKGFEGMCVNIATFEGGVALNVIPTEVSLGFSLRPPPGADLEAIGRQLEALAAPILGPGSLCGEVQNPPFETANLEGFRAFLGDRVDRAVDLAFWTEAALFAQRSIDAVVIGPGDIAQAHAPDEFVSLADLHEAVATFQHALYT